MVMRIRKERQASNLRITELEIKLAEAIDSTGDEYTYLEIIAALQNQSRSWIGHARQEECPSREEEEDDEGSHD